MIPPPEYFAHLYGYVRWADVRQLEAAAALSDDEYFKDRGWSFGSVHKLLLHMLSAQHIWLDRFEGVPARWLGDDPALASRDALAPAWRQLHERFAAFLGRQNPESLAVVCSFKTLRGDPWAVPLWQLLVHACNHAAHHRGQLNSMLKLAGGTPPGVDYSTFVVRPND